jgi:HEAT repeat protein
MQNSNATRQISMTFLALAIIASIFSLVHAQTAASPASLDAILKEIASYDGGIDSAPFWKLRDYVYARKDDPVGRAECETKLLEFLKTSATPVAKMAVCRQLRLIGSDTSVPTLQAMLLDPGTADMALYALQKIPGSAADKALLQTLSKVDGATKTAVIAALGDRRCTEAVPSLAHLLESNGEFAAAAAFALGEIGGDTAAKSLIACYAGTHADLKPVVASSVMECAEERLAAKSEGAAVELYDMLLRDSALPVSLRRAAMIGKITASGDRAPATLMEQLRGSDPSMQEAAIAKIEDVIKPEAVGPICSLLPELSEGAQIELLAVLSRYPKELVLPAVLLAARSQAAPVRIAALKALESVGDASTVPFLAETAAKSRGAEQSAARSALRMLRGRPVDDAVLALLAQKPGDDIQGELLLAIADRRIFAAKSIVAASLGASSAGVRLRALRALRTIGTPSDIPAVLDLLLRSSDDSEQAEAATTVALLAQKIANPDGRSNAVKERLATNKDPNARVRLYGVLSRIGDDSALPVLRKALQEQNEEIVDAAVRALAAWPTPAAKADVTLLAQKSKNETHRLLALQGFVRMVGLERYQRPESAVADLKQAARLASRPEEKKLILGVLPRFACPEALALAERFARDASVKAEALAAVNKIKPRLSKA